MPIGLVLLCIAYVLSQFFRAFLAVLAEVLGTEIGATPDDLAYASGAWFLVFALMQLPVGWLLDRIGPRRTASALLLIGGGGGAALFALAQGPGQIAVAMGLIGIGCSPVLMASYYIFARNYPPRSFAMLGALMLGVGSAGNLIAAYPTTLAVEWFGWRETLWFLAAASALVAASIAATVEDPARSADAGGGSVLGLLKLPVVWAILPMMFVSYGPSACLRSLWIGPYLSEVYGVDARGIGIATLIMGASMIAGTLGLGPLDRVLVTRKWVILTASAGGVAALLLMILWVDAGVWLTIALLAAVGITSGTFPVIIAHGKAFFPPHMVGRGVTLLNLFGIGGAGLMQVWTGRLHAAAEEAGPVTAPYVTILAFLAAMLAAGTLIYAFSRDSLD